MRAQNDLTGKPVRLEITHVVAEQRTQCSQENGPQAPSVLTQGL